MDTADKIKVMQAFERGEVVETRPALSERAWDTERHYIWDWNHNVYRVKPQPKVLWVNEYAKHNESFLSEWSASSNKRADAVKVAVKYQEVL